MGTYTNRTCNKCGVKKPQPQMTQQEIYVESGKSKAGISSATLVGAFLVDDKKSGNQFRNWLFNSGQRTYTRKKTVWMCSTCAKTSSKKSGSGLMRFVLLAIIVAIGVGLLSEAESSTPYNITEARSSK